MGEFSIDNKYQVFTLDLTSGINNLELETMLKSNFLTTFFVDDNGKSVSDGIVNISFNASKNYALSFLNGSKYRAEYQKIYVNAPAQAGISVRIFTSVDAYYEKEMQITNAVLEASSSGMIVIAQSINYAIKCISGQISNALTPIEIPNIIDNNNVKGINSILISNLDTSKILYFGQSFTTSNYLLNSVAISAGEKFNINFNPQCKTPYSFLLYSPDTLNYNYTISYSIEN